MLSYILPLLIHSTQWLTHRLQLLLGYSAHNYNTNTDDCLLYIALDCLRYLIITCYTYRSAVTTTIHRWLSTVYTTGSTNNQVQGSHGTTVMLPTAALAIACRSHATALSVVIPRLRTHPHRSSVSHRRSSTDNVSRWKCSYTIDRLTYV